MPRRDADDQYHRFPTTHWSLVQIAGKGVGDAKREALAALLKLYVAPLRTYLTFVRRIDPADADDLLQSFLSDKVLDQEMIGRAEQSLGKFRYFLLTALKNFVSNQLRAQRRARATESLDESYGDDAGAQSSEDAFTVAWARQVLSQTIERMRYQCKAGGRSDVWAVFEARVLGPTLSGTPAVAYDQLTAQLGIATPSQASNLLITANRTFIRILRDVIGNYERDADAIEDEIRDLRRALSFPDAGSP